MARAILNAKAPSEEYKLVCIGDKSKVVMQRLFSEHILLSGNEYGRTPPTFEEASRVAKAILGSDYKFDEVSPLEMSVFHDYRTVLNSLRAIFSLTASRLWCRTRRRSCPLSHWMR